MLPYRIDASQHVLCKCAAPKKDLLPQLFLRPEAVLTCKAMRWQGPRFTPYCLSMAPSVKVSTFMRRMRWRRPTLLTLQAWQWKYCGMYDASSTLQSSFRCRST